MQAVTERRAPDSSRPEDASIRYWAGVNIQAARRRQNLTQAALAKKAGISVKTLYNVENVVPGNNLTFETFEALSRALAVSPRDLLKVDRRLWLDV
jgi:transcriptional regulator with XRE-family HTH domain